LSALAVIIIAISLAGAIVYEVMKRREERRSARLAEQAKRAERGEIAPGAALAAPA
jgi:spermidine/putrescine transport system permease protein